MTPEQFQEVESLFESLLELPPDEREAALAREDADPEVRREVAALLLEHARPFSKLERTHPGERLRSDRERKRRAGPPTTLGPYTIVRELGRGGMGEVYQARDPKLKRDVAIKVLPPELRDDPERRQRFLREAQSAAKLSHPNVTQVFEIGEAQGQDFIALEYIDGETLQELLASRELAAEEILELALPVADALGFAHEHGIVHRDLKPANVMVSKRGHPKLLDFGLAKLLDRFSEDREEDLRLTRQGSIFGTPGAMSPEQALGRPVDTRSDVFSFGSLLYEMAHGRSPFSGATAGEVIDAVINADPPPSERTDLPPGLTAIIEKALSKDPADRYQSMGSLSADLLELQRRVQSGTLLPGFASSRGRRRLKVVVPVLLVATVSGLALRAFVGAGRGRGIDRIAVLPLVDLTQDPEQQYFVDGMHEALISAVGTLDGFTVLSRRSVMKYRDSQHSVDQIARELGVNGIVEGSLFRAGDLVRISVQLVRTDSGELVWSSSYEGSVSEALNLQREVARKIAAAIEGSVPPEAELRLATRPRVAVAAQEAYLRGRHIMGSRTLDGLRRAAAYFEEAVRLEEGFAEGHAGLAMALILQVYYDLGLSWEEIEERATRADNVAIRALELDPQLAQAEAVRGYVQMGARNYAGAERRLRRAVELNPSYALAHNWLGDFLMSQGRIDEAVHEQERACELDPSSAVFARDLGRVFFLAERYSEAIASSEMALDLEPDLRWGRSWLIPALVRLERFDEAWEYQREELVARGASSDLLTEAEAAYRGGGWKGLYSRLLDLDDGELPGGADDADFVFRAGPPHTTALPLAYIGRTDQALAVLERVMDGRMGHADTLDVDPMFTPLRSEPRFRELVRRLRARRSKP